MEIKQKIEVVKEKGFLTFEEIVELHKKEPPIKYLWGGIPEYSIGIFFGPPKSGKSTLCECLAIKFATGGQEFLGISLDGKPRRVLFLGLEENWIMRVHRNRKQYESLTSSEKELLNTNLLYQPIDYLRLIAKPEDWEVLESTIKESKPDIIVADSITRLNHGRLEDSNDSAKIMLRLRNLGLDHKVTIICIHHTPKIGNSPLVMDSMKGSVVFAQEADFIIGLRKANNGIRYLKNIEFRYADFDDTIVYQFKFTQNSTIDYLGTSIEYELLEGTDGRRADNHRELIIKKLKVLQCKAESTKNIVKLVKNEFGIGERQTKEFLRDLVNSNKIRRVKNGFYTSIDCTGKEACDEEE